MTITIIEYTDEEWASIVAQAEQNATTQGHPKLISEETPQNVLRLALGFNTRKRGGYRPRKTQQPAPPVQQGENNV